MRLHDMAVVISASNVANRYQHVYQHQAQAMSDDAVSQMEQEDEVKRDQVQQTEQESTTKNIDESDERFRQWKKGTPGGNPEAEERKKKLEQEERRKREEMKRLRASGEDHIIDIKV